MDQASVFFPGGIDVSDDDDICLCEGSGKFASEFMGPGVGVRLKDAENFIVWYVSCGTECGFNF